MASTSSYSVTNVHSNARAEIEGGGQNASRVDGRGRGRGWGRGGRGRGGGQANGAHSNRNPKPKLTHFISIPIGLDASLRRTLTSFTSSLLANDPPIEGLDASIVVPARRVHLTLGVMSLVDDLRVGGGGATTARTTTTTTERTSKEALKEEEMRKLTLSSAIEFLQALRPRILEILEGGNALVPLERIDVMRNGSGRGKGKGAKEMAHVLYAAPAEDEVASTTDGKGGETRDGVRRLREICAFIHEEFLKAGFVVDEGRPLKLHATLLNTIYRRPRPRPRNRQRQRTPFNLSQLLESDAVREISVRREGLGEGVSSLRSGEGGAKDVGAEIKIEIESGEGGARRRERQGRPNPPPPPSILSAPRASHSALSCPPSSRSSPNSSTRSLTPPLAVNLGTYPVERIQICVMGSGLKEANDEGGDDEEGREGEGAYVAVGEILLFS